MAEKVRDWLEQDPDCCEEENPIYKFYIKELAKLVPLHNDINLSGTLICSDNDIFFNPDGERVPRGCLVLKNLWRNRPWRTYDKRLSWALFHLKKAKKTGRDWKKNRYYWK